MMSILLVYSFNLLNSTVHHILLLLYVLYANAGHKLAYVAMKDKAQSHKKFETRTHVLNYDDYLYASLTESWVG